MINLVVLFGKSASGKDTIMQELLKIADGQLHEVISCTSRPPREGEVDGKNYYFMSRAEFELSIQHNDMIEYTEFNNWYYGISAETLHEGWNVAVLNPEGIRQLKAMDNVNMICIYIDASDKTRLLRQLNRESSPDITEIIRRYQADEADFTPEVINEYADRYISNNGLREPAELARLIWHNVSGWPAAAGTVGQD